MEEKKQTQKKEICQYSKRCGGCAFQGMSYEELLYFFSQHEPIHDVKVHIRYLHHMF